MTWKPVFYVSMMAIAAIAALLPIAFNFVVDPYDHNRLFDLDLDKKEISVKAHYPLYKMIEYPRVKAPTVVLGDSRARALQDRYWQELGRDDVYNFAYGGATVFEIFDTFEFLRRTAELETLIISLPLRSMDARFKQGMNRVPEAIDLANNPFAYYTNWFVAKVGIRLLDDRYPELATTLSTLTAEFAGKARAADFAGLERLELEHLLDPDLCAECALQTPRTPLVLPTAFYHHGLGLGRWSRYWPEITIHRDLPALFAKQVGTNGAADWRRFKQSDELWAMVETIADWCAQNDVDLVFLIPPTISEMQRRISDFGLSTANHRFRERLSRIAPVIDFDFDSSFTRDLENFTDAYHFSSDPARRIVGELLQVIDRDPARNEYARNKRDSLVCPVRPKDITRRHEEGSLRLTEGNSCRIWRNTGSWQPTSSILVKGETS